MSKVESLLRGQINQLWIPAQAHTLWGLTIYPIYRRASWNPFRRRSLSYAPLGEALSNAQAKVGEMPSAHVPEILVTNSGRMILLGVDGDELVGGQQNRVLNSSVLLAHGETKIPVSCVERGRWDGSRKGFTSGERLPHGVRKGSHGKVHENLSSKGHYASDQRAIWSDIESGHSKHGVRSSTHSMHDTYQAKGAEIKAFEEALPYARNAVGMVVAIGGQIVGCDVFDQARTAEHYWPRLVRACAVEALETSSHGLPADPPDVLLKGLWKCKMESFPSPGLGHDIRFKSPTMSGSALVHEDIVVHLSLFAEVTKS